MTTTPPRDVVSFTVSGDWAHFARISGNISRLTYRIPPRTTVAGLIAAITGQGRDEYYDVLGSDNTAIAVEPLGDLPTMTIPENILATASGDLATIVKSGYDKVQLPDPTKLRKQRVFEFVTDPAYRIHVSITDKDLHDELVDHVTNGTSVYTPCLGISECLASISDPAVQTPNEVNASRGEELEVDSTVPTECSVIPTPESNLTHERSQADFELGEGTTGEPRRQTTGFRQYVVDTNGNPIRVSVDEETPTAYRLEADETASTVFFA